MRVIHEAECVPVVDVVNVTKNARIPLVAAVVDCRQMSTVIGRQQLRVDELMDFAHVVAVEEYLIRTHTYTEKENDVIMIEGRWAVISIKFMLYLPKKGPGYSDFGIICPEANFWN